jgi:inosine/xanthosine triphosphate pyrophosphatase family protein
MKIHLLTWNPDKIKAAQKVFDEYNIELILLKPDIPEIQAHTSLEIAKHTAIEMAKKHNLPVLREDHALYINTFLWWFFPGPYTSYFDKSISAQDFLKRIYPEDKPQKIIDGYFELGCCYAHPNWKIIESSYKVDIEVSPQLIGERWNIDKFLMIKWSGRTFAECAPWENTHYWTKNFITIAKTLVL